MGKLYLFAALIKVGGATPVAGFWYVLLAVIGVVNSVISLYFYARVVKAMYLESAAAEAKPVGMWNPAGAVAVALAVPVLVLGVFWEPLSLVARWSANVF